MQRKKIITLNFSGIKPDLPFIIFSAVFIIGVLLGCLSVGRFEQLLNDIANNFGVFVKLRKDSGYFAILQNSVMTVIPFYIITFLCGTSVIGCVISPIVLAVKGFSYGCIAGYLYFTYRLEGIMFNALILIPSVLIAVIGLLVLTREAFSFSYLLSGICIKSNKPVNIYSNFKLYCVRSLVYIIFAIVAVLLDIGMSALFISFFKF